MLESIPTDAQSMVTKLEYSKNKKHSHASMVENAALNPDEESFRSALSTVILPIAITLLLCNMDRICMSVAIMPMSRELGWAPGTQGLIQSSFLWGYMATQLLGGTLADRHGGRLVMAAGIAWFSLASFVMPVALQPALIAAGLSLPAVLLCRALVGFGEGVALPSMNNLVAAHIPRSRRASALGACFGGFHSGNLVGLLLSPFLLTSFGWRTMFVMYGLLGIPMFLFWLSRVPRTPPPLINASPPRDRSSSTETSTSSTSIAMLLSHPATWAIIVANFVNHWGYFIYLNWMPSYFNIALGLDVKTSALFSFLPWLVMAIGSSCSGLLADHLLKRGKSVLWVRRAMQSVSFIGPSMALLLLGFASAPVTIMGSDGTGILSLLLDAVRHVATMIHAALASLLGAPTAGLSPRLALLYLTAALGLTSLGQAGFVANMSDIAPRRAGQMFGLCNTFGSFAGVLGVSLAGLLVQFTGTFQAVFFVTAALYLIGIAVFWRFARGEVIFD